MSELAVTPSSEAWVRAALADVPTLLIDHAHCEKKAASTAVRFLFKYPDWPRLVSAMSKLAREELLHFDRVLRELAARGVPFRGLGAAGYAAALFAAARSDEPGRRVDARFLARGASTIVDEMLCCALIEARSHERFVRLAAATDDVRLKDLYEDLLAAEERHGSLYLELAEEAAGGNVSARLAELAAHEAAVLARPGQPIRMHAGG